jgi:hypothetical protein
MRVLSEHSTVFTGVTAHPPGALGEPGSGIMRIQTLSTGDYDVVVVGARPAGAATALLLASRGSACW